MRAGGNAADRIMPGAVGEPRTRARIFAPLALVCAAAAVIVLFALSPIFLEAHGYAYETSGGSAISKVHPATIIALMALGLRCLAARRPVRTAWRIATRDRGVVLYLAVYVLLSAFAIVIIKTPFTPLIDTLLLPLLFLLLLRDLDEKIVRILALILAAILAINACIALVEYLYGWRLVTVPVPEGVTSDPTRADGTFDWRAELMQDWRASALFGHPLQNGVVAGAFVLCLASAGSRWMTGKLRWPLLALQILSLFAFGARTSLVLSLSIATLIGFYHLALMAVERRKANLRVLAFICFAVPLAVVAVAIAWDYGFFDRTIDRFVNDAGSAGTRFTMFEMFRALSWNDLLLGPDPRDVATWQRLLGLEFGIESSWIGLVLVYGIVMTLLFVAGLIVFCRSLVRAAGRGALTVLLFYLIVVSTAATLSGKTTTLAMMTILILLFLRRQDRGAKLPQPLDPIVRQISYQPAAVSAGTKTW